MQATEGVGHEQTSESLVAEVARIEVRFIAPLDRLTADVVQVRLLLRKLSLRTDPPDHACMWDLNQWTIACDLEFGVWIRLAEVTHRAVVNDPGAAIRAELDVGWTIEPARAAHERLFKRVVVCKPHNLELKWFFLLAEVEEFDLVSGFRRPIRR